MVNLQPQFDDFIERISLGQSQWARIDSAYVTLREYLAKSYGISQDDVFAQGSCANGTAIKPPPEGEYDLDIVVVIPDGNVSSTVALEDLERILAKDSRYAGKLKPKKPCVRIQYADDEIGGFHIDVVPGREDATRHAPLEAPRRNEGWHGTAPAEYTAWCRTQGDEFARTVKALKRWRDEQQDVRTAIKSIVLQVLIAECMPRGLASDARRISQTLTNLQQHLARSAQPPVVLNPVLPAENLAASWSQESFISFKQHVAKAQAIAERAIETDDPFEAAAAWHELLGEDFPLPKRTEQGLVLADASHAKRPESQGWVERLDSRYRIGVRATVLAEDRRRVIFSDYPSDGPVLQAGWKIRFRASITGPLGGTTWWQVVNTGGHARNAGGLRGDFFRAKTLGGADSTDPNENWEDTSYTGTHWIEAFLVQGNVVLARSGAILVNVRNKRFRFQR
jgi:hypothetical protein